MSLTLAHARHHIGSGVVYDPGNGAREDGVITEVRAHHVMVRYAGDQGAKATPAERLTLLASCTCSCQVTDAAHPAHQCAVQS